MTTASFSRFSQTDIRAPSMFLALTEVPRALGEYRAHARSGPLSDVVPTGDGHPVLVIPGFMAGDVSTAALRSFLDSRNYAAHGWDLGRNFGPRSIGENGELLIERLHAIHEATGRTVSLVGWSLGGIMARVIAQRAPEMVRQVVTLGAPFAGSPRATHAWRVYEWLTGQKIDHPAAIAQMGESASPARVPSTAIFSRADGVVAWQNCREADTDQSENIEVNGSHLGLCVNPAVLRIVADRLAQREGAWRRFRQAV